MTECHSRDSGHSCDFGDFGDSCCPSLDLSSSSQKDKHPEPTLAAAIAWRVPLPLPMASALLSYLLSLCL